MTVLSCLHTLLTGTQMPLDDQCFFLHVQTLQDMLTASQQDLEAFLTQVYRAIAGAAPLKDKVSPIS